jgi:pyruvate/2-oxoglutarate/acetoin dehydrogenase E1 component
VAEIMFGDFLTLAADQIINHAAKFAGMYNGQVQTPVVVRTPSGGGRGYGPTHSQTLEKHFLGVPGLRVAAPSHFGSPGALLEHAILRDTMPVLFIESKLLYPLTVRSRSGDGLYIDGPGPLSEMGYPVVRVRNFALTDGEADATVVAYGGVSRLLEPALKHLAEEEIRVEALLPTELSRAAWPEIDASVRATRRVVLVEEGAGGFGWTAGLMASLAERIGGETPLRMASIGAADSVVPCARDMEREMLPASEDIVEAVLREIA